MVALVKQSADNIGIYLLSFRKHATQVVYPMNPKLVIILVCTMDVQGKHPVRWEWHPFLKTIN